MLYLASTSKISSALENCVRYKLVNIAGNFDNSQSALMSEAMDADSPDIYISLFHFKRVYEVPLYSEKLSVITQYCIQFCETLRTFFVTSHTLPPGN